MSLGTNEFAVVLHALEIRAASQGVALDSLGVRAEALGEAVASEADAWAEMSQLLGGGSVANKPRRIAPARAAPMGSSVGWASAVSEARSILRREGIDPDSVSIGTPNALEPLDVVAALAFGALGAALPSLGSRAGIVSDWFADIQSAADGGKLPGIVQSLFGQGSPAAFMDAGAAGMYHRFKHGHDLLWAIPAGVSQLGLFQGVSEVFQHLLRDSFGATGIPLPGSTLIGDAVAGLLGEDGLTALIRPRTLSRFGSLRATDGVATGTTALLLWLYCRGRGIQAGSAKAAKMAILAHGFCFVGVAIAAAIPGLQVNFPFRSRLNYVSLTAMLAATFKLWRLNSALRSENKERMAKLEASFSDLLELREQDVRDKVHRDLLLISDFRPEVH